MEFEVVAGVGVISVALVTIVYLTIWSRRMINKLAARNFPSARDANLELRDE